jgi:hypothetical protein
VCRLQECNIGQFYKTIHNLTFVWKFNDTEECNPKLY